VKGNLAGRSAKAVITVPAFFTEHQAQSHPGGWRARWPAGERIINEPTAAALAYGAGETPDETMLVYDLGGGTFDVSVVSVQDGVVEVRASHGDTHLGGDDFDQLLADRAVREFRAQQGVDLSNDGRVMRRLRVMLERAKCRLSRRTVRRDPRRNIWTRRITSRWRLRVTSTRP